VIKGKIKKDLSQLSTKLTVHHLHN